MAEQKTGLKKQDHDLLRRALTTHEHVTGERASHLADTIPVQEDEDPEVKAAREKKTYEERAGLNARVEETEQAQRRARAHSEGGAEVQPGNPGGGNEALATDRAKAEGNDRKGIEPPTAKPSK